jgi:hypothetical protein
VTKSGRKVRQYGWVYEVMAMDEDNGCALCRWWAKALPSGGHEREYTFVLTEDAENAHHGLEKSWYAISVGDPEATLLDVTIVSEIKWRGNDPRNARLNLDPLEALFNFVGNACIDDIFFLGGLFYLIRSYEIPTGAAPTLLEWSMGWQT